MAVLRDKLPNHFAELHEQLGRVPLFRIQLDAPPGLATEEDVIRIARPKTRPVCELIDGVLVEKVCTNLKSIVGATLIFHLLGYVHELDDPGFVVGPTCAFRTKSGNVFYPDASYLPWDSFPNGEIPKEEISSIIPELAVRFQLDDNTPGEIDRFVREMFVSGVKRAWIVHWNQQSATDYLSPAQYKMANAGDCLTCENVLPGFSLPLPKLFSQLNRIMKGRSR